MCTRRTLKLTNDLAKVSEHMSEPGRGPRSPVPASAPVRVMVSASFTLVGRCPAVVRFSCAYLFPSRGWGGVMPSLGVLPCSLEQPAWSGLCSWGGGHSSEAPRLTAGPNNVACDFWPGKGRWAVPRAPWDDAPSCVGTGAWAALGGVELPGGWLCPGDAGRPRGAGNAQLR